ncbi:uncharacterized protein K452DRAFT_107417 [Aplosporella prunicola CBS 121167]|uniref:Uncharacterized protein n=1 Tax=Aplosporella prunicola CBS 121167 TaxID=1176127 RepID=A0A6A6BPZ6_9PEZI|nr:uncharacterized protein K452DRAFT_107417 [Aplosporella prunicola CBS 121167]KAF2146202.1 hypothetical protein K452DRAFT_107417 [Aplosporella prunicola CBS 121167]
MSRTGLHDEPGPHGSRRLTERRQGGSIRGGTRAASCCCTTRYRGSLDLELYDQIATTAFPRLTTFHLARLARRGNGLLELARQSIAQTSPRPNSSPHSLSLSAQTLYSSTANGAPKMSNIMATSPHMQSLALARLQRAQARLQDLHSDYSTEPSSSLELSRSPSRATSSVKRTLSSAVSRMSAATSISSADPDQACSRAAAAAAAAAVAHEEEERPEPDPRAKEGMKLLRSAQDRLRDRCSFEYDDVVDSRKQPITAMHDGTTQQQQQPQSQPRPPALATTLDATFDEPYTAAPDFVFGPFADEAKQHGQHHQHDSSYQIFPRPSALLAQAAAPPPSPSADSADPRDADRALARARALARGTFRMLVEEAKTEPRLKPILYAYRDRVMRGREMWRPEDFDEILDRAEEVIWGLVC